MCFEQEILRVKSPVWDSNAFSNIVNPFNLFGLKNQNNFNTWIYFGASVSIFIVFEYFLNNVSVIKRITFIFILQY